MKIIIAPDSFKGSLATIK